MLLPLFPVRDALPELDSMAKAITTEIQQKNDQQREIIATAKQRGSLMLSCFRGDKRPEEPEEKSVEEENEVIECYHCDMPQVCFGDDVLLKPDTRYCFSPDPDVKARAYRCAASDNGSDSEDSGNSNENSDNPSDQDETETETDVQCINTTTDPYRALNIISQYCDTLRLELIQQESISDPTDHLKTHKQTHLPANQGPRAHQCDHEGCSYSTDLVSNFKRHKKIHLPADQRLKKPKVHQCDYKDCHYRSDQKCNLKTHKQTHLPADQRPKKPKKPKVHQCDHEGCDYSTDHKSYLKKHKQTHLPIDQRINVFHCDHEGCYYSSDWAGNLNRHKRIHLLADKRSKRPKRKASDQLPSDEKRKKVDQE